MLIISYRDDRLATLIGWFVGLAAVALLLALIFFAPPAPNARGVEMWMIFATVAAIVFFFVGNAAAALVYETKSTRARATCLPLALALVVFSSWLCISNYTSWQRDEVRSEKYQNALPR